MTASIRVGDLQLHRGDTLQSKPMTVAAAVSAASRYRFSEARYWRQNYPQKKVDVPMCVRLPVNDTWKNAFKMDKLIYF